jgi:hypothetical protein
MTLRLDCTKRNFELEVLKSQVKAKRINVRENPLSNESDNYQRHEEEEEPLQKNGELDSAATTITHKLGQHDPLADFHKLENLMLSR